MKIIGTHDAKAHLRQQLKDAEAGKAAVITRQEAVKDVIARMKARRAQRQPVSTKEILEYRDEGRK